MAEPVRITRKTQYAVINVEALRGIQARTDQQVQEAQHLLTKDALSALEEMINVAKAGRLEGQEILALRAVMWK